MQRRAAAVYGVFLLVVAIGSAAMIGAASAPAAVSDPDHRLSNGDEVTIAGQSYAVTVEEGEATLEWHNESARYTETWENGSDVTFQGTNYSVSIPDTSDPLQLTLVEVRTLPEGTETTTVNDTEYVVVERDDGTRELVPTGEYLAQTQGEPERQELVEGQAYDYRGNRTTLASVDNESATLAWTAPRNESMDLAEGDVVDLGDREFVASFPDDRTLVLDRDVQGYERQQGVIATYHERISGLWGVSILAGLAAVLVLGLSYLPSRY